MSMATGRKVMSAMMQAVITTLAAPRGKHDPNRHVVRHGSARSSVTLGHSRGLLDVTVSRLRPGAAAGRAGSTRWPDPTLT